jgi:arylsulfatase
MVPALAGRPSVVSGNVQLLFPGSYIGGDNGVIDIKNKSHQVTAEIEAAKWASPSGPGIRGVIAAQGSNFGGWALYVKDAKLKYAYNFCGLQVFMVEASQSLPEGKHEVRMEFKYDGGGLGKGGMATLYVDGKQVGQGRVEHTHAIIFSCDSVLEVGYKTGAPICKDLGLSGNEFSGKVRWVQINVGSDSHDHLLTPEERYRVHMSIQ